MGEETEAYSGVCGSAGLERRGRIPSFLRVAEDTVTVHMNIPCVMKMTLDPENISLTNLHEAIIEPKSDGQINKNKHVCLGFRENRPSHHPAVII